MKEAGKWSIYEMEEEIDLVFNYALKNLQSYQPWESYYRLRRKELQMILHFFDIPKENVILELGCGPAFTSSLFSSFADTVIAIDLPEPDSMTSTFGMGKATRLIRALRVQNVHLVGSSASSLPVRTGKADLIYSQYVLEHIPMHLRLQVVKEMKRALSDKGSIIAIVPNFLDRIYNYPYYYFDLLIRLLALFKQTLLVKMNGGRYKNESSKNRKESYKDEPIIKKFRRFIFPPIHGNYQSRLHEIIRQFPFVWERLFKEAGLSVVKTFAIKHSPLATKSAISFYEKTGWISKIIGGVAPFKYLGDCYCIIAKKTHE